MYSFLNHEKLRTKYLVLGLGGRTTFRLPIRTSRIPFKVLFRIMVLNKNAFSDNTLCYSF